MRTFITFIFLLTARCLYGQEVNKIAGTEVPNIAKIAGVDIGNVSQISGVSMPSLTFACGGNFKDPRDGKTCSTVSIGSQCWFSENINIGTRINGTDLHANNATIEKYCYSDLESNCNIYGGLYQWDEAMQYVTTQGVQGICPAGWHFPTDAEWTTLSTFLGGTSVAGGKMKSTGTIQGGDGLWYEPNTGADNTRFCGKFSVIANIRGRLCDGWKRNKKGTQPA